MPRCLSFRSLTKLRKLLKLAYGFTTLVATIGGRGFKAKGFSHFLRIEIERRKSVLADLYQKSLEDQRFAYIQNGSEPEAEIAQREILEHFKELDGVLKGNPMPKRITAQPKDDREAL